MSFWRKLGEFILHPRLPYRALFQRRAAQPDELEMDGHAISLAAPDGARDGRRWRALVFNLPLVVGGMILLGLFLAVLFGPLWAPSNPYISGQHIGPHYDAELGAWLHPPLPPSAEYPLGTDEWGNDILSMLLYGARNTLIASAFITMLRVLIGTFLGSLAGWNEGRALDQLVMGLIGVVTAIPMLVSSMILIYALDIRRGLPVFIVALAAIGWTEIAQYIRSEFLVIRRMPYIEGARAVGARGYAIAVRHVLPNILPQLLVITFLEIGAVLMLLGELGFVGVYIGGGSRIALGDEMTGIQVVSLVEIPEWGAMLAEGYRWLRARPHVVFPPAAAFFCVVLGFNAFGEGLRRVIEVQHINTAFLLRKRMLLVVAALSVATVYIINNTGPAPWFVRLAQAFEGDSAYEHTRALAGMQGRGAGQAGGEQAAAYIAEKFAAYGLDPGWRSSAYIYPFETRLVRPVSQPVLEVVAADGQPVISFTHQVDFGYMIEGHAGSGSVQAPLTFLGFTDPEQELGWENFQGLDLRGRILLVVAGNAPENIAGEALIRGAQGMIWVSGAERDAVRSQVQLAETGQPYLNRPTLPVMRLRSTAAEALLSQVGLSLAELLNAGAQAGQDGEGWYTHNLELHVRMQVELGEPQAASVPCILGFLPGSDFSLANELVVLAVNYDGLGIDPDGSVYAGANHNAAGVGILLEIARLWQAQALEPRRSVLFVAWGGGHLDESGLSALLTNRDNIRHLPSPRSNPPMATEFLLQWDYSGAGGEQIYLHPNSGKALAEALEATAGEVGLALTRSTGSAQPFDDLIQVGGASSAYLAWEPAQALLLEDTFDALDPARLEAFGQVLTLTLTRIVRQDRF